jgi:hypothetical protein
MRAAGSLLDEFAGHVLVLIELLCDRASVTDVHLTRASGPRKSDRRPRCRNNERSCAAVVSLRRGGEEAPLLLSRKPQPATPPIISNASCFPQTSSAGSTAACGCNWGMSDASCSCVIPGPT